MMKWGLAIISMGGVFVMMSQLTPPGYPLIVTGVSFMVIGLTIFLKGRKKE